MVRSYVHRRLGLWGVPMLLAGAAGLAHAAGGVEMQYAPIPGGIFLPLYGNPSVNSISQRSAGVQRSPAVKVLPFSLSVYPVTKAQFRDFVSDHPEWRRSAAKRLFTDEAYLRSWKSDLEFSGDADQPATEVSWFAAKAFCKAHGGRLPTTPEWEYAGRASETKPDGTQDEAFLSRILSWYSKPDMELGHAGGWKNFYGVYDMHGLVWEWVSDFNSALVTGESRGDAELERNLFCGGGAIFASEKQKRDYAAFMRYAFRSSLQGTFSLPRLGFRCARNRDKGSS